jgi:hypothetical protein
VAAESKSEKDAKDKDTKDSKSTEADAEKPAKSKLKDTKEAKESKDREAVAPRLLSRSSLHFPQFIASLVTTVAGLGTIAPFQTDADGGPMLALGLLHPARRYISGPSRRP